MSGVGSSHRGRRHDVHARCDSPAGGATESEAIAIVKTVATCALRPLIVPSKNGMWKEPTKCGNYAQARSNDLAGA